MNTINITLSTSTASQTNPQKINGKRILQIIIAVVCLILFTIFPISLFLIPICSILYYINKMVNIYLSIGDLDFKSLDDDITLNSIISDLGD